MHSRAATNPKEHELALQRVVAVWIVTGLAFMLLPGTFMGVWNLLAISSRHTSAGISPGWIQAHGHAQIFGWIGSFILGIGFYSLSKMGGLGAFPVRRAWTSWALWSTGVALRWIASGYGWHWRTVLPLSAGLELAAFLLFFLTVRRHRPVRTGEPASRRPAWMNVVVASTLGFLVSLVANVVTAVQCTVAGIGPYLPHAQNQAILMLFTWGFPVLAIWGFSARWLPVFLGLPDPNEVWLYAAVALDVAGIAAAFSGAWLLATLLTTAAAAASVFALHVFTPPQRAAKITGVHWTFPHFVRIAYGWLLVSAALSVFASQYDHSGGLWGASRHALTVGLMATMVFSIGQRVLPAFCGMRVLFSTRLMFLSLALLTLGCFLRVVSEACAYEGFVPALWAVLPVSALIEMAAVTLFAANLVSTLLQPPAHERTLANIGQRPAMTNRGEQ